VGVGVKGGRVAPKIFHFPESHPVRHRHFRRALLRRCPCGVSYAVEAEDIVILAVMHLAQDPSVIAGRLK